MKRRTLLLIVALFIGSWFLGLTFLVSLPEKIGTFIIGSLVLYSDEILIVLNKKTHGKKWVEKWLREEV